MYSSFFERITREPSLRSWGRIQHSTEKARPSWSPLLLGMTTRLFGLAKESARPCFPSIRSAPKILP